MQVPKAADAPAKLVEQLAKRGQSLQPSHLSSRQTQGTAASGMSAKHQDRLNLGAHSQTFTGLHIAPGATSSDLKGSCQMPILLVEIRLVQSE
jgi:hypothetical protein